jgi:hypothetical protein
MIFALVIGISTYLLPDYELKYAASDADRFQDFLIDTLNVPRNHIISLRNEAATRSAIIEAFQTLQNNPQIPKDEAGIIIYFAGHGARTIKPKEWVGWATADEQIELMCPCDIGTVGDSGEVVQGIPDRTISVLLNRIAELKGNNIVGSSAL